MQLAMQLSLPRDARCVGMMRNVASCLLRDVEAPDEAVEDLRLAISEACANAVLHAQGVDDYWVSLVVDEDRCEVEVVDMGTALPEPAETGEDAENGRGLSLIRALVDDLEFDRDDAATRLRLVKSWSDLRLPRTVGAER